MEGKTESRQMTFKREQYLLEKELASILNRSTRAERSGLYTKIYKRFFDEMGKYSLMHAQKEPDYTIRLKKLVLGPFLVGADSFLEIGGGDHAFIKEIAKKVDRLIAVDAFIPDKLETYPSNIRFIETDMPPYPIVEESVDLAFSSHFIEHLMAEDQVEHMAELYRIIKPGGSYVCITPNPIYGPHDVSGNFGDLIASGLHLNELSYSEMYKSFKSAGFKQIRSVRKLGQEPTYVAFLLKVFAEKLLIRLTAKIRNHLIRSFLENSQKPFRPLEQVIVVATK